MIIFPVSFAKGRMLLLENDTRIKIFSNLGLFTSVTDEVVTARKNLFVIFSYKTVTEVQFKMFQTRGIGDYLYCHPVNQISNNS